eukprot:CAMPEP_0175046514 /NCGR_PEP_ID=MMETSP0052_2-20121109/5074_1 /TAXON_ID=51329 ORGANISM="Polytomella parva, Strain SAG 63-3" /NCGR_SAMPLE_ID=MMETSP0052_2 /ASSEMBLY_ACC=CAM_ASM_000194 /LENGTH=107 /DNA_ID=CAMNT_0016310271 /DNA_START=499 /DNA_END=819 /DNA_ORIENTATION=-
MIGGEKLLDRENSITSLDVEKSDNSKETNPSTPGLLKDTSENGNGEEGKDDELKHNDKPLNAKKSHTGSMHTADRLNMIEHNPSTGETLSLDTAKASEGNSPTGERQ